MTKIRKYTIPGAAALAVAAGVSLATAPAQAAAIVTYTGCGTGATYCTLEQLLSGGSISVDENGDGKNDKVFGNWHGYQFSPTGMGNPITDPQSKIQVSAGGTFGAYPTAWLDYTVVGDALKQEPNMDNLTWNVGVSFAFDATAVNSLIIQQKDELTGASAFGPIGGVSNVFFNGTGLISSGTLVTAPPIVTDIMAVSPAATTLMVMNSLSVQARKTSTVAGVSNLTSFKQTFTQATIPEPGTVVGLLVVSGLGLGMKRKQKGN